MNKDKIKILVDAHVFDNEYQGSRTYIREIYKELSKKNDLEIYFAAQKFENLEKDFDKITLEKINFIPIKSSNSFIRTFYEIPQLIKKNKIDFAHFQYICPVQKKCKYITTTHDLLFLDFKKEFSLIYRLSRSLLFRMSINQSSIVTTVSEYSRKAIVRHFKTKKQIVITHNGVDQRFYTKSNVEKSKDLIFRKYGIDKSILYVSRFEPRKNHHLLLQAFLNLNLIDKGYHLVLLGHKSLRNEQFEQLYSKLSNKEKEYIFINESISNEDLFHFYNSTDLFVYLSKAEGFGIPPLEAAALCKPVICSNATAMQEFDFFGENHISPNSSVEEIQKLIEKNLNTDHKEEELSKISKIIHENYNWNSSAEVLYNAIKKQNNENSNHRD